MKVKVKVTKKARKRLRGLQKHIQREARKATEAVAREMVKDIQTNGRLRQLITNAA